MNEMGGGLSHVGSKEGEKKTNKERKKEMVEWVRKGVDPCGREE